MINETKFPKFPFKVVSGLTVYEPVLSHNPNLNFFVFDSIKNIEIVRRGKYVSIITGSASMFIPVYFILFKFDKDLVYDCWLNYFAPEGKGAYVFDALSKRNFIYLHFYSPEGYVCAIRETNEGKDVFKNIKQEIEQSTPLSQGASSFARKGIAFTKAAIMRSFKSKNDFWEKLIQQQ
jgi:hypothetical protein